MGTDMIYILRKYSDSIISQKTEKTSDYHSNDWIGDDKQECSISGSNGYHYSDQKLRQKTNLT